MAQYIPPNRRTYVPKKGAELTERATNGKERNHGRPTWVQPHLLLALSVVLVVITTVVVAIRNYSPQKDVTTKPAARAATASAGAHTDQKRTSGPTRSGESDKDAAAKFHGTFVASIHSELRRIGFRPALIERQSQNPGVPDRWTVRVPSNFPILRMNAEVTILARKLDGEVYRAEQDSLNLSVVKLDVGAGNVVTDEVLLIADKRLAFTGTLAFVIDDIGYRTADRSVRFVEVPQMLTLAILPHHDAGEEIARRAAAAGKDVILHLPMEPSVANPSVEPNTITTEMSEETIRDLIERHIESVPGLVGVNNHMGSKATEDERVMNSVLSVLKDRGLFFLDSRTTPSSVAERTARERGVLTGSRDVFLDNDRATAKVVAEIRRAADLAAREGIVIAIGHDRDKTYAALAQMLPRLDEEGYRICAVAELLR